MEKLTSSSTRDGEAGTNKFNPTSSFVSEWMFSPDVVFFHGIIIEGAEIPLLWEKEL